MTLAGVARTTNEEIAWERYRPLRRARTRIADPRITSAADASSIAQSNPLIAWMAYTIHGNESASFEAMMQVVYQLAASNEAKTLEILDNTIVLILAGENPDGHERFVTWYNSIATGNAVGDKPVPDRGPRRGQVPRLLVRP